VANPDALRALGISTEAVEHSKSIFTANKRIMDQTLRVMDESVDPRVNFVNYASGKYGKNLYLQFDFHLAVHEKMNPKFLALFEQLKYRNFEWPKGKFEWLMTLARLNRDGVDLFFRMNLELDHQEASRYMIIIEPSQFILHEYYAEVD